jgi:sensor histidine kinase regulating citrate/malate metabolism
MINHIKNSLEANADKIYILFSKEQNNMLYFRIVDNGNGILPQAAKDIFKPNFSTKSIGSDGVRGNGLYLNKSIISSCGGSTRLVESSKFGTTFELAVPTKHKG